MLTKVIPLLISISASSFPIYGQIAHAKTISVPSYPELPKIANIQGLVQLELSVENGRVVSFKPISGPIQLAKGPALKRVLDWEFETTCPKTITLYFEFFLQPYDGNKFYGGTEGSIIELRYPNFIKISSKLNPPVQ